MDTAKCACEEMDQGGEHADGAGGVGGESPEMMKNVSDAEDGPRHPDQWDDAQARADLKADPSTQEINARYGEQAKGTQSLTVGKGATEDVLAAIQSLGGKGRPVGLGVLGQHLHLSPSQLHSAIDDLRRAGKVSAQGWEGSRSIDPGPREYLQPDVLGGEPGSKIGYVVLRGLSEGEGQSGGYMVPEGEGDEEQKGGATNPGEAGMVDDGEIPPDEQPMEQNAKGTRKALNSAVLKALKQAYDPRYPDRVSADIAYLFKGAMRNMSVKDAISELEGGADYLSLTGVAASGAAGFGDKLPDIHRDGGLKRLCPNTTQYDAGRCQLQGNGLGTVDGARILRGDYK